MYMKRNEHMLFLVIAEQYEIVVAWRIHVNESEGCGMCAHDKKQGWHVQSM